MKRSIPLLLLLAAASLRADIAAKLSFEPATVQAGIPASVVLTVTNSGSAAVVLPRFVALNAQKSDGTSFPVTEGTRRARPMPNAPVSLPAHGTAVIRFDPDGSWSMPWFADPHLTVPGTYGVSARLLEKAEDERGLASSTGTLTVTAPQGDDAAVCEAARKRTPGAPASSCPVRTLLTDAADQPFWAQHRASSYATFYAGAFPAPLPEQIAALEALLKRSPNDPIADWRRIYLAKLEHLAAGEANARKEAATTKSHAAHALALYRQVASQGRLPDARKRAAALADDLDRQMTSMRWR